jgi:hypothetical protein
LKAHSAKHDPEDFDWIFLQFNQRGIAPVVVAGQAVNIWGKVFREWDRAHNPETPKIDDLLPLTSEDLEILATGVIKHLDQFKGVKSVSKTDPFGKAASPDAATYYLQDKKKLFKVQVLSWVNGVDNTEIQKRALPIRIGSEQAEILLPDPITLLRCKIANLVTVDQNDPPRQDLKHVRILICCIRAFIAQTIEQDVKSRQALKLIQRLRSVVRSKYASRVKKEYGLNWAHCLPLDMIEALAPKQLPWSNFLKTFPRSWDG